MKDAGALSPPRPRGTAHAAGAAGAAAPPETPVRTVPLAGPPLALAGDTCLLTIDVEDYFHASGLRTDRSSWDARPGRVEYTTRRLLQILDEHRVRATFFVLGWVAARYPGLVREIAAAGHEVASHGWNHELVYEITPARFRDDVRRSRESLEQLIGRAVLGYRAPSFSIVPASSWAVPILAREGYRYDSSVYPVRRARYGVPTAPRGPYRILQATDEHAGLLEIPPASVRLLGRNLPVAGGGYLRAYPLSWTIRAMRRISRRDGWPPLVYLHPWEIDPDQPRVATGAFDGWRHYLNLDRTEERLCALLRTFSFAPIAEALAIARPTAAAAAAPARPPAPPGRRSGAVA